MIDDASEGHLFQLVAIIGQSLYIFIEKRKINCNRGFPSGNHLTQFVATYQLGFFYIPVSLVFCGVSFYKYSYINIKYRNDKELLACRWRRERDRLQTAIFVGNGSNNVIIMEERNSMKVKFTQ